MSIRDIFLIYLPFAVLMVVIFITEIKRRLKKREDFQFIMSCVCVILWYVCNLLMLLTDNINIVSMLYHIKIIFVGYCAVFLLFFMMKFYRVFDKLPRYVVILMLIIPSLTVVISLTGHWHNLLVKRFDVVSLMPIRNYTIVWGAWFWIHTAYSYILLMAIIVINLVHHFREPKFYRTASSFMIAGVTISLLSNLATISNIIPSFIDTTVIGVSLSLIMYNKAIISNDKSRFARYTQRQVLHFLDEYIFILDAKQNIVDINLPAEQLFAAHGISLASAKLKNITNALQKKGRQIDNDFYIEDGPFPITLSLRIHNLTDEHENIIGYIAVFSDVTQNRRLIEQLEITAKIDALTDLPNRQAFEGAKKRLNNPGYLPLAVIVGDVNMLKDVNDNLGHQYGDMMLQKTAEVLKRVCPDDSFFARIGGDEFIFLLPGSSRENAAALMAEIKAQLSLCGNLPFKLSVSLGSAVKYDAKENLDDVIALADSRMYEDKKAFKESMGMPVSSIR